MGPRLARARIRVTPEPMPSMSTVQHPTTQEQPVTAAEKLAQLFHETYERLAPNHGYDTRKATAVPWAEVKDPNRQLMIDVARQLLGKGYTRTWVAGRDSDVDFPPDPDTLVEDPDGQQWACVDDDGWVCEPARYDEVTVYTWAAALGEAGSLREVTA
jgi:hypothetical protein